jgi:hypothetical protein
MWATSGLALTSDQIAGRGRSGNPRWLKAAARGRSRFTEFNSRIYSRMSRRAATVPVPSPVLLPSSPPEPARALDAAGRSLWDRLHGDYAIDDEADLEQLLQACQAVDLIETGTLEARAELAGRNFVVKTLRNLFPDEKQRGPGRPPKVGSW